MWFLLLVLGKEVNNPEIQPRNGPLLSCRTDLIYVNFCFKHALPVVCVQVFLTTLSDLQTRECLQDIDSWTLFANLNELCLVKKKKKVHLQIGDKLKAKPS